MQWAYCGGIDYFNNDVTRKRVYATKDTHCTCRNAAKERRKGVSFFLKKAAKTKMELFGTG